MIFFIRIEMAVFKLYLVIRNDILGMIGVQLRISVWRLHFLLFL